MKESELLQKIFEIEPPWHIVQVREDAAGRQVDVWVGQASQKSGWFFRASPSFGDGSEPAWRHVNLAGWRSFVHVLAPAGAMPPGAPWCGDPDMPFTRAMARQVGALIGEGIKFQSICAQLDLRVDDVWRLKHSLDKGRTGLSPLPGREPPPGVPAPDDPVWSSLLDGSVDIDIRALPLKLILTKMRAQMDVISDAEVRVLKAHEMHRFFARHVQLLGHELAQLRRT